MDIEIKKGIAKVIVDLYEIRSSTIHKHSSKEDKIFDNFKYNFFSSVIAQMCSKYEITEEDIRQEIFSRNIQELI